MGGGFLDMVRLVAIVAVAALLAACAVGTSEPPSQPSFYRSMATPNAEVDAAAAA